MHKIFRPKNFTTKGKTLKSAVKNSTLNVNFPKENISSLALFDEQPIKKTYEPTLRDVFVVYSKKLNNWFNSKKISANYIKKVWVMGSFVTFSIAALIMIFFPMKVSPQISHKYSIYSATPLRFGSTTYQIYSKDARSQKINMVFRDFKCPLEGLGEVFVYEADKNNIPWWIVAAISFQESSCGKKTPEPKGIESYNAWGWGVYGDNMQGFDNWARGIETVSEYLSNRFFSKGITEACDIMKVYTPPSKGSWCEGVNHYGELMQNYSSDDKSETI